MTTTKNEQNIQNTQNTPNAQNTQNTEMSSTRNGGSEGKQPQTQPSRRNPLALLDELQDDLAGLWGRPFRGPMMRPARLLAQLPLGAPRLDVYEADGSLVVKADVPGVKKEDLHVELEDGDLVIQGEARTENEVKEDHYYRMERRLGRFYRRIPLPFEVKPEDIQATLNDGVLEVRIPKPSEQKSPGKPIAVN